MPSPGFVRTIREQLIHGPGITAAIECDGLAFPAPQSASGQAFDNGITPFLLLLGGKWC